MTRCSIHICDFVRIVLSFFKMTKNNFGFVILLFAFVFTMSERVQCKNRYFEDLYAASIPDTYLTTPKIIRRHGYPAEAHIIQSEDGYLLEYHRIPHSKNGKGPTQKYPILLHHGLLCSSIDWVINGPGKSLAYHLADKGYDVWMANARGNTYSRSHISLSPTDKKFWDYSFHEMGVFDVPAAIDYILNVTSAQQLIYIGHSLGTTTFFTFATGRPEYHNKILTQISIAPVAAISHTTSMFRALVPVAKEIEVMTDWYYKGAFLEHDKLTSWISKYICGRQMFNTNICEQYVIFNLFGKDKDQFNTSLIPIITSNIPAGTSGKNMLHCAQLISSGGKFRCYDYGITENIKRYKSAEPPSYNISQIPIPMKFFYGKNDILADPTDVEILYQQISKPMGLTLIEYDKWNHVDFLWGIDVNKYFNEMLLEFVDNVTTKSDFIMESVERALIERHQNQIPHYGRPFNETEFQDRVTQIPGLTEVVDGLPNMLKKNFENSISVAKGEIEKKVDEVQSAVNNSLSKAARSINDGIQKTTDEVNNAINKGVTEVEKGVNASVQHIELQMQAALDKLAQFLSNGTLPD